jgi:hypothetical protein
MKTNVASSLFGKALHCECKEQGSPASGGTETTWRELKIKNEELRIKNIAAWCCR